MKVVIIDDDKLVSMSLKMILENGTDIEVAAVGEDGREAVSLYKKYSPDILLLDIRMQYMTGLEAARNVLAAYPDAKILFLTTFSDDEYIIEALEIGVKGRIGNKIAIEMHVRMPGPLSLYEAHEHATRIERRLKQHFGADTHVGIHLEPIKVNGKYQKPE